jgi:crotonobetaine/carnitine-CoA ligase
MTTPNSVMPPRERCVLPAMLDAQAERLGDKPLIIFDGDEQWSYATARQVSRGTAAALQKLGIQRGEPVLVWLPNTSDIVRVHFGLCYMGGIFVPINLALRGGTLEHIIRNSGARTIICHAQLLDRLAAVKLGALERVVVFGGSPEAELPLEYLPSDTLTGESADFEEPSPPIQPWEPHGIFYTSGTTGPSKGVITPHVHTAVMGRCALRFFQGDDRFLMNLPYYHLGGALTPHAVLGFGASMALMKNFRTEEFWDEVRRTQSTCCFLLGAVSTFLMKQPARDDDADNPLRTAIQQPLPQYSVEFAKRFGVAIYTQLDMTEMGPAIMSPLITDRQMRHGYCGRLENIWPIFEVRLVDENDCEVPIGEVGELVVRCDMPHVISPGYWAMPEATAKAWRNGWFHTGDAMRRDAEGNYYFVDRTKDSIRRRGENISSAEVEEEVLTHADVADAAAVGVTSKMGEQEVLVVVEPKPGRTLDPRELLEFLRPRMPHYMVPRYIRIMEKMPYTETHKVQKARLRSEGATAPGVWDREAHGIQVKRELIG